MDRSKDMENSNGLMVLIMMDSLKIIILMDKVIIFGLISGILRDPGSKIRCMDMEYSHGKTEELMKVIM